MKTEARIPGPRKKGVALIIVLWVMAILSNWTVSQRIWYTWRELSALERRQGATTS